MHYSMFLHQQIQTLPSGSSVCSEAQDQESLEIRAIPSVVMLRNESHSMTSSGLDVALVGRSAGFRTPGTCVIGSTVVNSVRSDKFPKLPISEMRNKEQAHPLISQRHLLCIRCQQL